MNYDGIPAELKAVPNWCTWKWVVEAGKRKKIPHQVNGERAKSNDPKTWTTFKIAYAAYTETEGAFDGICCMMSTKPENYVFIDIDHCVKDRVIEPWALDIVERFDSYTEISQSGKGLHIIIEAKKPFLRCRKTGSAFEIYDSLRPCYITGDVVNGLMKIRPRQELLDQLMFEIFGEQKSTQNQSEVIKPKFGLPDEDVLKKAIHGKNGEKVKRLLKGDLSDYGGDDSAADQALADILCFYCGGDYSQIESIFSSTKLGQRKKWTDREDYKKRTIDKAIEGAKEYYDPSQINDDEKVVNGIRFRDISEEKLERKQKSNGEWKTTITRTFSQTKAADVLVKEFDLLMTADDDKAVWYYNGRIYSKLGLPYVYRTLLQLQKDHIDRKMLQEVQIRIQADLHLRPVVFNPFPSLVSLENGVLDCRNSEFRPFRSEDLITDQLQVKYDRAAKCPGIIQFIESLTPDTADRITLIDILASGAYRRALHYVAFLLGHGGSGSSTFIQLLQSFYGTTTTEAVPLKELLESRFALSALKDARYSIGEEIDEVGEAGTSAVKRVSGGDWISADQKNKGRARFRGWTKLVFTANKIPRFTDETWAFRRRFIEVQLPFKFVQTVNPNEPNERQGDPKILDKITLSSELSGLANLIAARLPWITKNCQIYRKPGHYEAYKEQTDSVTTFLERYCTFLVDASSFRIPVNRLHGYFKRWADLTMGNLVDARWFGRFIKRYCNGRPPIETTIDGHTCTVYPGLVFDEIKYNEEIAELERRLIGSNRKDIGSVNGLGTDNNRPSTGLTGLYSLVDPDREVTPEVFWDEIRIIFGGEDVPQNNPADTVISSTGPDIHPFSDPVENQIPASEDTELAKDVNPMISEKAVPDIMPESKDPVELVREAVAQFEAEGRPVVPSVLTEYLGTPSELKEVVGRLRDLGYTMTQEIDPASHMPICKRCIMEQEEPDRMVEVGA